MTVVKEPIVNVEASEKETVKNSIIGQLMLSKLQCVECHAPVKESWTSCLRCGCTKAEEIEIPKPKEEKEKAPE